jgi:hypothetical protein
MHQQLSKVSNLDRVAAELAAAKPVICPLQHIFTTGQYTRIIFMPAGTLVVSEMHKTQHPFFVSIGRVEVLREVDNGFEVEGVLCGGHIGVTEPGTRRFLKVLEDTVWSTVVPNPKNLTDPDEVVNDVMRVIHDNPLLPENDPRINVWKKDISPSIIHNKLPLCVS